MELRPFGHTEREVSVIGHGTWRIDERERNLAIAALHRSLELGMTHIDTAEMYGDAENIVGEAIEGRRDQVFLVSKVLPRTPRVRGRSRPAKGRSLGSKPTTSTATYCTGAGRTHSR